MKQEKKASSGELRKPEGENVHQQTHDEHCGCGCEHSHDGHSHEHTHENTHGELCDCGCDHDHGEHCNLSLIHISPCFIPLNVSFHSCTYIEHSGTSR